MTRTAEAHYQVDHPNDVTHALSIAHAELTEFLATESATELSRTVEITYKIYIKLTAICEDK